MRRRRSSALVSALAGMLLLLVLASEATGGPGVPSYQVPPFTQLVVSHGQPLSGKPFIALSVSPTADGRHGSRLSASTATPISSAS